MANTEHLHPFNSSLAYSTNGSSYTTLSDARKIQPPELDREESNDTSLDSMNKTKELTPGWRKTGQATAELYLTKAQAAVLKGHYDNELTYFYKFTAPLLSTESVPSTLVWQGFVKTLKPSEASVDSDDKLTLAVTFSGTKGATWASGS